MIRSLRWLVLVFLVVGVALGAAIQAYGADFIRSVAGAARAVGLGGLAPGIEASGLSTLLAGAGVIEAIGGVWLNALRMTVAPLVFALLVASVASVANAVSTGKLAARAVLLFTVLIFFAATYAVFASMGLLALWPVDRAAADAFLAGATQTDAQPVQLASIGDWLKTLVPVNVFQAAAEDAILPLTVFAILFGFAATRLREDQRETLVSMFTAIADAMVVIVHWILLAAPIGVFALALSVGLHAGFGAASLLAQYAIFVSLAIIGVTLLAYVIMLIWGRMSVWRFAAAIAPAQVVAASTQSSIATLPAMLETARESLGVPKRIADLILPMAVGVFRFTSPVGNLAVCFFIATLYDFHPSALQIVSAIFVSFAVSVSAVGLPGQVSFITSIAPICLALGLPVELLGILIAVEVIPDIFRTIGNVTGDLMVTTLLRKEGETEAQATPSTEPT